MNFIERHRPLSYCLFAFLAFVSGASVAVGFMSLMHAIFIAEGVIELSLSTAGFKLLETFAELADDPFGKSRRLGMLWTMSIYAHSSYLYAWMAIASVGGLVSNRLYRILFRRDHCPFIAPGFSVWLLLQLLLVVVSEESRMVYAFPITLSPFVPFGLFVSTQVFGFLADKPRRAAVVSPRHLTLYALPLVLVVTVLSHFGMMSSVALSTVIYGDLRGNSLDDWAFNLAGGTLMAAGTWLLVMLSLRRNSISRNLMCAAFYFPLVTILLALALPAVTGWTSSTGVFDSFRLREMLSLFDGISPFLFLFPIISVLALAGPLLTLSAYALSPPKRQ